MLDTFLLLLAIIWLLDFAVELLGKLFGRSHETCKSPRVVDMEVAQARLTTYIERTFKG